jgi:hypothetical protein
MGAEIRAKGARQVAQKAIRRSPPRDGGGNMWSVRMEGYGGPPSRPPRIGQCLNGTGVARGGMQSMQDESEPAARRYPPSARYADKKA